MTRFVKVTLFVAIALATSLIGTSCDKNDSVTDPVVERNSATDSTLVSTTVGERIMDAPFQTIELSSKLLQSIPGNAPAQRLTGSVAGTGVGDGDDLIITAVLSYTYADGWHVFQFEAVAVNNEWADTVDIAGVDSVRVIVDGMPVQHVDDSMSVEAVLARAHLSWSARSGNGDGAVHHSLDVSALPMGLDTLVTIDGFAHDSLAGIETTDSASCTLNLAYNMVISELKVRVPEIAGDCPESGDLTVSVGISAGCVSLVGTPPDSVTVNGTWTVTAHVNDDNTITVTYSDGILFWRTTTSCDDDKATAERSGWWTGAVASSQVD